MTKAAPDQWQREEARQVAERRRLAESRRVDAGFRAALAAQLQERRAAEKPCPDCGGTAEQWRQDEARETAELEEQLREEGRFKPAWDEPESGGGEQC